MIDFPLARIEVTDAIYFRQLIVKLSLKVEAKVKNTFNMVSLGQCSQWHIDFK